MVMCSDEFKTKEKKINQKNEKLTATYMLSEEPPFILFKYSEQITAQTTINFNVHFFLLVSYLKQDK